MSKVTSSRERKKRRNLMQMLLIAILVVIILISLVYFAFGKIHACSEGELAPCIIHGMFTNEIF